MKYIVNFTRERTEEVSYEVEARSEEEARKIGNETLESDDLAPWEITDYQGDISITVSEIND